MHRFRGSCSIDVGNGDSQPSARRNHRDGGDAVQFLPSLLQHHAPGCGSLMTVEGGAPLPPVAVDGFAVCPGVDGQLDPGGRDLQFLQALVYPVVSGLIQVPASGLACLVGAATAGVEAGTVSDVGEIAGTDAGAALGVGAGGVSTMELSP